MIFKLIFNWLIKDFLEKQNKKIENMIKLGSKGDDVKKIQEKLGLTPDGIFGQLTLKKVKEFQKENGLPEDGIVNNNLLNLILSQENKVTPKALLPIEKLKGNIPDKVLEELPSVMGKFNINNNFRLAHFLGQCAHESNLFKSTVENLNYSAKRLKEVFPKYFPGDLSNSYANNPCKIASRVYANRMGNRNEASQDGFTFRGRGYIQTTGFDNYYQLNEILEEDILKNPDLISTKYPLTSAAFFFNKNNLWNICDGGISKENVTKLTKKINGGINGLEERIKYTNNFYRILTT